MFASVVYLVAESNIPQKRGFLKEVSGILAICGQLTPLNGGGPFHRQHG